MLCHLLTFRPHFVSFVWLVPRSARCSFVFAVSFAASSLSARASACEAWALWSCGLPLFRLSPWSQQASQVRGMTPTRMPCSYDPGGPQCLAFAALRCCLPRPLQRRLLTIPDFGAQSHGLLVRCLRFAVPAFPDPPRKTRFRLVASLCRTGLSPVGSSSKGFRSISLHLAFSFSTLCLAHRGCRRRVRGFLAQ